MSKFMFCREKIRRDVLGESARLYRRGLDSHTRLCWICCQPVIISRWTYLTGSPQLLLGLGEEREDRIFLDTELNTIV